MAASQLAGLQDCRITLAWSRNFEVIPETLRAGAELNEIRNERQKSQKSEAGTQKELFGVLAQFLDDGPESIADHPI